MAPSEIHQCMWRMLWRSRICIHVAFDFLPCILDLDNCTYDTEFSFFTIQNQTFHKQINGFQICIWNSRNGNATKGHLSPGRTEGRVLGTTEGRIPRTIEGRPSVPWLSMFTSLCRTCFSLKSDIQHGNTFDFPFFASDALMQHSDVFEFPCCIWLSYFPIYLEILSVFSPLNVICQRETFPRSPCLLPL